MYWNARRIESKMINQSFDNKREWAKEILEIIHADMNSPHLNTGYRGQRSFLSFIGDYSECARIYCIVSKSETARCFKNSICFVQNQFGKLIKRLLFDKGTEYLNQEINDSVCDLLPYLTDVHELNGVAEHYNGYRSLFVPGGAN